MNRSIWIKPQPSLLIITAFMSNKPPALGSLWVILAFGSLGRESSYSLTGNGALMGKSPVEELVWRSPLKLSAGNSAQQATALPVWCTEIKIPFIDVEEKEKRPAVASGNTQQNRRSSRVLRGIASLELQEVQISAGCSMIHKTIWFRFRAACTFSVSPPYWMKWNQFS